MKGFGRHDGFTLVEMLVVLAIIAVAAAISFPIIGQNPGARQLNAISMEIASALRMTRDAATARNREQQLVIDFEHHVVNWPGGASIDLPDQMGVVVNSAAQDVTGKTAAFRYFPDGGSTGGSIVLTMNGASRQVAVNWLTGAIAIEDATPK